MKSLRWNAVCFVVQLSFSLHSNYFAAFRTNGLLQESELSSNHFDLQRLQFQKIAENDALIKSQRHDLHHQLTVLQEYYEQNEREKLGNYLKALYAKLPSGRDTSLCKNYAVNAVASHYADMAKRAGDVVFQASVYLYLKVK